MSLAKNKSHSGVDGGHVSSFERSAFRVNGVNNVRMSRDKTERASR